MQLRKVSANCNSIKSKCLSYNYTELCN